MEAVGIMVFAAPQRVEHVVKQLEICFLTKCLAGHRRQAIAGRAVAFCRNAGDIY